MLNASGFISELDISLTVEVGILGISMAASCGADVLK
jgi:hypothetical protein